MEDDFEQWFLANDGYIHPFVELASDELTGRHMRVVEGKNLAADSLIISCPHELTISWLNVIRGSEPFLGQFALGEAYYAVNQVVIVRFFLMNEYLKKKDSFWWPYIQSLPQPTEAHLFGTPLYYDDNDWAWIRGTNLEHAARKTESMWRLEYDEAMQSLVPMTGSHANEWTWTLYKWAATIMSSRCFPATALINNVYMKRILEEKKLKPEDALEPGSPVIIPGNDLLNHRPSAKVTWQWTSASCRLVTNEDLASGAQMSNNYGQKSNEERYGFSIVNNPADHCGLTVLSSTSQSQGSVTERLSRCDIGPDKRLHAGLKSRREPVQWVRLRNSIVDRISSDERASFEFSPGFLNELAAALSNQREKASIHAKLKGQIDFSSMDLSRIQLKMIATITMLLQRQISKIVVHNSSVPPWPENGRQFHAARYRREQLHILRTVDASLLSTLSQAIGLRASATRNPCVVRLEHMLMESPPPLLIDFRAALNAGLGTRKAAKIRERGWVECVFAVWVCGVWLWGQSPGFNNEVSAGFDLASSIRIWLRFLHDTYSETLPQPGTPAIGGDPVSFNSPAEEEQAILVDSYVRLIEAAVLKNPRSLYSSTACTRARLLWCLHIVREESVMCPSFEGKSGDENDELVLFLENCEAIQS